MKRVLLTLLLLLLVSFGSANSIEVMEFFWDDNSPVSFTAEDGDWNSALENAVKSRASTPADAGTHTLNVRSKDTSGVWSEVRSFPVFVEGSGSFDIKTALGKVSNMEFFWDEDAATSFSAVDGNWGSALEQAIKKSASTPTAPGAHTLNVRSQNAVTGVWSDVRSFPVYVEGSGSFDIKTALGRVSNMEFYWDEDAATSFSAVDGNWGSALEQAIKKSATTPTVSGAHTLNVRSQNAVTGVWSDVRSFPVYVEGSASFDIKTALGKISAMEFFWDEDAAVALTAADGNWGSALEQAIKKSASTPTEPGAHTLNVRSQNAVTGVWSDVRSFPVYVEGSATFDIKTALGKISAMEFFWDEDAAVAFTAADGNWGSALEQAIKKSASTPTDPGAHVLNVRSQNAVTGVWSDVRSFPVYVEGSATFDIKTALGKVSAMEFFWDELEAVSFTAADGNWGSALEQAIKKSASTPTEPGAHTLNVRSQNAVTGTWSEVRSFPVYVEESATFDIKTALGKVSAMEFFWDESEAVAFTAADGNWSSALEQAIKKSASTPTDPGAHTLNVRSQNAVTGTWSEVRSFPVYVEESASFDIKTALGKVSAMEFFWDEDAAVAFTAADGNWGSALEQAIKKSASTPIEPGAHVLNVRSQNAVTGTWSDVRSFPVYVEESATFDITTALGKVSAMEFFWDDNSPTSFTAADGNWGSALEQAIKKSARTPVTPGFHTLNVRSQNLVTGAWSTVRTFPVYVEESATFDIIIPTLEVVTFEYFFGEDPGIGAATAANDLQFSQGVNRADIAVSVPTEELVRGVNFGGVRVLDHDGIWSPTRVFTLLVEADSPPYEPVVSGADSVCFSTSEDNFYAIDPEYQGSYEWFAVGGELTAVTDSTALVNWDTLASDHTIKVVGTNSFGTGDTAIMDVFVEEAPTFIVAENGNYLAVQEDPRWEYQWTRQGVDIPEANNAYYWATEDGNYRVNVVTQCGDSIRSNRVGVIFDPDQQYPKDKQSIMFADLKDSVVYGDAKLALDATASSGLEVKLISSDPAVIAIEDDSVVIVGVGTATIRASQSGNFKYAPAAIIEQELVVSAKTLDYSEVAVNNRRYDGTSVASLTGGVVTGVVEGDVVTLQTEALFSDKTVGTAKEVTVTMTLVGDDADKYEITAPIDLTGDITPAQLTISANDSEKHVGDDDPEFTAVIEGFVTGETESLVSGLVLSREPGEDIGTYAVKASGALCENYEIDFVDGVFEITNTTPTLSTVTNQTIDANTSFELLITMTNGSDADEDPLSVVIGTGENYTAVGAVITPALDFSGTLEVPVQVTDGYDSSSVVIMTIEVKPAEITQTITFSSGWNMISLAVNSDDMSAETLFEGLNSVKIVKNDNGKSFIPGLINGVGDIKTTEGYLVYCDSPETITVTGKIVDVATAKITLSEGWNMIPYLPEGDHDIDVILSDIKDQIGIVKDDKGGVYIPVLINTIGKMKRGNGYEIYVKEGVEFIYPEN